MLPVVIILKSASIATLDRVHDLAVKLPLLLSPYEALFWMYVLCYVPFGFFLFFKIMTGHSANTDPRDSSATVCSVSPLAKRLMACHNNLLEGYPFFAAAALAATQAGVAKDVIGEFASVIVAARVAYTFFYAAGINEAIAGLRTVSWLMVIATNGALFLLAAEEKVTGKKRK